MDIKTAHFTFEGYQSEQTELLCVKSFVETICYCIHGTWAFCVKTRYSPQGKSMKLPPNGQTSRPTFMAVAMAINEQRAPL